MKEKGCEEEGVAPMIEPPCLSSRLTVQTQHVDSTWSMRVCLTGGYVFMSALVSVCMCVHGSITSHRGQRIFPGQARGF